MLPIVDAATASYDTVRDLLRQAGYTEESILARTGAASVAQAFESRAGQPPEVALETHGDVLHRLFFDELATDEAAARRILGNSAVELLLGLRLLERQPSAPGGVCAAVLLYPLQDLYIASDRSRDAVAPDRPYLLASDAVYPAITPNTSDFLSLLPAAPHGRFLELCAGTGVAALLAAHSCEQAVAADITERATAFAAFNARLNGLKNVRAVCGDVWDAVGDEVFDRIVAHPPYAPALDPTYIYRDGGEDGERVTRRILSGLGAHLAHGGRFHATCCLTELPGEPVERRVRALLGDAGAEMDVLVVSSIVHDVTDYHFGMALGGELTVEEAERLTERMNEARVERIVLCTLLIARHETTRTPVTLRGQRGTATSAEHFERALAAAASPPAATPAGIEALKPRLSPHARMQVTHAATAEGWAPLGCVIMLEAPFRRRLQAGTNLATLLDACDGESTARDLYDRFIAGAGDSEDLSEESFARVMRELIDEGYLVLDAPPPLEG